MFLESKEPKYNFSPVGSKATVCDFTLQPDIIITGHESGKVSLFNAKTGEEIDNNERAHSGSVTDLQVSNDRTYCITSSKDKSARVCCHYFGFTGFWQLWCSEQIHDTKTLMVIKTYTTETPLNSSALAPNRPYVGTLISYEKRWTDSSQDPSGWWPRSQGRYDNITQARQIWNTILAQGVGRRSWKGKGPFRSHQYVRIARLFRF